MRERLPGADAAWLHMDRRYSQMVITAALWSEQPMDWEKVVGVVRARIVARYPRFCSRIVESARGPLWERVEDFDPGPHFHRVRLSPPGDEAALQALVGELMGRPLDRRRPLWEVHLVDGYGSGSALVVRIHHCIADGIVLSRVLFSLTDAPEGSLGPPEVHRSVDPGFLTGRHRTLSALRDGGRALRALGKLVFLGGDARTALKAPLGPRKRAAWSRPVTLSEVKAVGRALGATVNDVLLAAVSGALHAKLRALGGPAPDLRALVPYNLRPGDGGRPPTLGNDFGLVFLALPTGDWGAVERVAEVHRRMEAIKTSAEGPVSYALIRVLGWLPGRLERPLIDFFSWKGTVVATNVPGPRSPVYLAGTPLRGVMPWVPQSGSIGLGVSIMSYAGEVRMGLMSDAGLVDDPGEVLRAFEAELETLTRFTAPREAVLRS